jgi:hypothetical protein
MMNKANSGRRFLNALSGLEIFYKIEDFLLAKLGDSEFQTYFITGVILKLFFSRVSCCW